MATVVVDLNFSKPAGKDGKMARRSMGFWCQFNSWYRAFWEAEGRRPSVTEVKRWYDEAADACWGEMKPTWDETRTHSKCLRSLDQVRSYFRQYRAAKKECTEASNKLDLANPDANGVLQQPTHVLASGRKFDDASGMDAAYIRAAKIRRPSGDSNLPNGSRSCLISADLAASDDTSPGGTFSSWTQGPQMSDHATATNIALYAAALPTARVIPGGQSACPGFTNRTISTGGATCGVVAGKPTAWQVPRGNLVDRPASSSQGCSASDRALPLATTFPGQPSWTSLPSLQQHPPLQPRQHASASTCATHVFGQQSQQLQQQGTVFGLLPSSPPPADRPPRAAAALPSNQGLTGGSRGASGNHQATAEASAQSTAQLGQGRGTIQPFPSSTSSSEPTAPAVATSGSGASAFSAISGPLNRQRSGSLPEANVAACMHAQQQAASVRDQAQMRPAHLTRSSSYHPPASHHHPLVHMGYGPDPSLYAHSAYVDPYGYSYGMPDPYWGMYLYCYPAPHHLATHASYLDAMPHPQDYQETSYGIATAPMDSRSTEATRSSLQQHLGGSSGPATLAACQLYGVLAAQHQVLGLYHQARHANAAEGQACGIASAPSVTLPTCAAAWQQQVTALPKVTGSAVATGRSMEEAPVSLCSVPKETGPRTVPCATAISLLGAGSGPLAEPPAAEPPAQKGAAFNEKPVSHGGPVAGPNIVAGCTSAIPSWPHDAGADLSSNGCSGVAAAVSPGDLTSLAHGDAFDATAVVRVRAPLHCVKSDPDAGCLSRGHSQLNLFPVSGLGDGNSASLDSSLPKIQVNLQRKQHQWPGDFLAETPVSLKGVSMGAPSIASSTPAAQSLQLGVEMLPIPDLAALDPELDLAMFLFSPPAFAGIEHGYGLGCGTPL